MSNYCDVCRNINSCNDHRGVNKINEMISDLPRYTSSLSNDDKSKHIIDYFCSDCGLYIKIVLPDHSFPGWIKIGKQDTDYRKILRYGNGVRIKVGDKVKFTIRRFLWWKLIIGVVDFVYDPFRPSPPRGNNDDGVSVVVESGKCIWVGGIDKSFQLIGHKE